MLEHHRTARDGVLSGIIGATAVAVWFLLVDAISGRALYTPTVLGGGLLSVFGPGTPNAAIAVTAYTVFHYAVFIGIGLLAALAVHQAEREPEILAAAIVLFIIFELGFYGLTALLAESHALGALAWYQVALGNVVAAVSMGVYLWRVNPTLREELVGAFGRGE